MTTKEAINKYKKNIVFVGNKKLTENKQIAASINGTGLILEGQYILTCAHVYNEIPKNKGVQIFAGIEHRIDKNITTYKTSDLELVSKDDLRDLCLLKLSEKKGFGVKSSDFMSQDEMINIGPGQEVIFMGFPLANDFMKMGMGLTLFTNKCIVGAVKYSSKDKKLDFFQIDSHVNPSNSGSPLIDLSSGKILGIVKGTFHHNIQQKVRIPIPRNMGIVAPSIYVRELIESL